MLAVACSSVAGRPEPSALVGPSSQGQDPDEGANQIEPPPAECTADFCGGTFLEEVNDPPNLYFLVDRSGSMAAFPPNSTLTKYDMARRVLGKLLRVIGHRAFATAQPCFPRPTRTTAAVRASSWLLRRSVGCRRATGPSDPVLAHFLDVFRYYAPGGARQPRPRSPDLAPELEGLDGKTYLVLITDGAPNCNLDASDPIVPTSARSTSRGRRSAACRATATSTAAIRTSSVRTRRAIAWTVTRPPVRSRSSQKHGIPTYVIGMPGAEPYADVLDSLATAGGLQPARGRFTYYAVTDQTELTDAAGHAIGTGVAIKCSIDLDTPPDDQLPLVNVYFDGTLVPADPDDGWSWDGDSRIVVNGAACDELKSGSVTDARAVLAATRWFASRYGTGLDSSGREHPGPRRAAPRDRSR